MVSHGLTIRIFCMRYLGWTVEEFDATDNPRNCEIWILEKKRDVETGAYKYELALANDSISASMRESCRIRPHQSALKVSN